MTVTAAAAPGSQLPIRFTASGSEYFRIWIVNLLLTLVTAGLYRPWAKVRKLRYFYGNTWVGEHSFESMAIRAACCAARCWSACCSAPIPRPAASRRRAACWRC